MDGKNHHRLCILLTTIFPIVCNLHVVKLITFTLLPGIITSIVQVHRMSNLVSGHEVLEKHHVYKDGTFIIHVAETVKQCTNVNVKLSNDFQFNINMH